MSRIRSVHPGFFRDEDLVACSAFARLLFIGLGVEADDKGVFEWKPIQIKMSVFPGDNVDVAALLGELVDAGNIMQFDVGGKRYGAIRNFRKFQKPKTPNDIHPASPDIRNYVGLDQRSSETETDEDSSFPQNGETFPQKEEKSPQMEDGGGKMEEEKKLSLDDEREFVCWYETFPRHVGKGSARKAYRAARKKASADDLLAAARVAASTFSATEERFVPHPATWLNAERWLDDGSGKVADHYDWNADPANRGVR